MTILLQQQHPLSPIHPHPFLPVVATSSTLYITLLQAHPSRIRPFDLLALQHFLHPQACHVGGLRASPHHQLKSSALLHVVAPTLSIIMSLTNLRSLQIYVHLNLRNLILLQVYQYRRVDTRCLMRKESTLTSTKHASVLASLHLKLVSC